MPSARIGFAGNNDRNCIRTKRRSADWDMEIQPCEINANIPMVKSFTNTYAEGAKILSTLPKVWTLKVNHSKSLLVTSTMECLTRRQVALITTQRPLRGSATPLIGSVSDRERRRRLVSAQHHGSQEYRPHFFPSLLLIKNQNMVSRSIGRDDSERHCVVLSRAAKALISQG